MLVTVFVAGAAGAVCRYLLDGLVQERWAGAFPMGTFAVNILGAFLLGVLTGAVTAHPSVAGPACPSQPEVPEAAPLPVAPTR